MAGLPDGQMASRGDACKCVARVVGSSWGSSAGHGIDPNLVEIRPEPSPAERVAILMALEQMLEAMRNDAPPPTAWAVAGRRESRPGGPGGFPTGWGRGSDRLAGW